MKRSELKIGALSLDRGSTFKAERKPLERRTALAAVSARRLAAAEARGGQPRPALKQTGRRRRTPTEAEIAREWHKLGCRGRLCVKSGEPAGPHAHHCVPQHFLKGLGLHAHLWDIDNAVPVTLAAHMNHEAKAEPITRAELQAAGIWDRVVQWARMLDARCFPGREPVLARLERDYPA